MSLGCHGCCIGRYGKGSIDFGARVDFGDTDSESGADAFVPVFSETGFLFDCLVKLSGNQFNDVVGAFSELSMFVSYERYEFEAADCLDMAVFLLLPGFFVFDEQIVVRVFLTAG